jgi:DNA-directed RNA polymerase specialized sigma24 family protein
MKKKAEQIAIDDLASAFKLLPLAQQGDRDALNKIAEYLYPYCKSRVKISSRKLGLNRVYDIEDLVNTSLCNITCKIGRIECSRGIASFVSWVNKVTDNVCLDAKKYISTRSIIYNTEIVNDRKSAIPAPADIVNSDSPKALALAMHYIRSHVSENKLAALTTVLENPDSEFRSLADHLGVNYRTFKSQFYRACEQLEPHKATLKKILGMDSDANEKTSRRGR